MADFLGEGVSRTLTPAARNFVTVVMQKGKPPLDAELNLISQLQEEARQALMSANIPSGFIGDPIRAKDDYQFSRRASNLFWLGKATADTEGDAIWANVNGWLVPVIGTNSTDSRNALQLPPPQASATDSDVNFIFLEVWKAQLAPDGTVNKPSEATVWKYGNVEYGGTNVQQDFLDPAIGMETSERVQLQYRIRVVDGVNPSLNPYGFNSSIRAQGTLSAPTTSTNALYQFSNMRDTLGDPGLWRAGDGDGENGLLGTVDGYVYALPIAMVFRRTNQSWSFLQQAGGVNRNPNATSASDAQMLPEITLTADIDADDLTLSVDTAQSATTLDSGGGLLSLEGEIVTYTDYTGNTITLSERGSKGTAATNHDSGAVVDFVTGNPLGLFSDQVVTEDVWDRRHIVSLGPLDFDSLLRHNFQKLLKGELKTVWKKSSAGLKGLRHFQVDYLGGDSPAPDFTIKGDAPDGLRKIFSDACALQPNNLIVLGSNGSSASTSDLSFNPTVDIYRQDASAAEDWNQGDVIEIALDQYRNTFSTTDDEKVRFVHPFEYDGVAHDPIRLWFGDVDPESGTTAKQQAFTISSSDTDPDFVVLGSLVDGLSVANSGQGDLSFLNGPPATVDVGLNFTADTASVVGKYLLLTPGTDATSVNPENHGAFLISGVSGGGLLEVTLPDGTDPTFATAGTTNRTWGIYSEECADTDDSVFIALASTDAVATNVAMYVDYDLLYHPSRGLSRVPETALYVDLDSPSSTAYVREDDFSNVATSPTASVKRSPALPMTSYPVQGHSVFQPRDPQDVTKPETAWGDAYVDPGSKTLVFQPLRNISVRLEPQPVPSPRSYSDVTSLFNLSAAADSLLIPKELRAPLGRQDLPFVTSLASATSTSTAPAYGINHLLLSGSDDVNSPFVQQRLLAVYDPVNTTTGDFGNYPDLSSIGGGPGGVNALVCRYYNQGGVRGIEIPANYGIARLFAIYVQDDFYTISPGDSNFAPTSGAPYRTDSGVGRDNLLRQDGERRSLIITDSNTFVIPEDAIDQSYLSDTLENSALIFEFAAFFFDDWTQDYMRIHRLATVDPVSNSYQMFVHGPALVGDDVFSVTTRVPYQGSIYGTMPISTTDTGSVEFIDYVPKRETENPTNIVQLTTAFEDPSQVRTENATVVEVLSAIPFATTLGSGAISGSVEPGTYTDVGYLSLESYPFTSISDPERASKVRAHPAPAGSVKVTKDVGDSLAGLSERLPLGLLSADYQFLGEGMGQDYARLWTPSLGIDSTSDYRYDRPLSKSFLEGALLTSDGTAAGSTSLTGYDRSFNLYRTYRGGVVATASGKSPGGAVVLTGPRVFKDLSYLTTPEDRDLSIHGNVLLGVALLVRTQEQTVTTNEYEVNYGEELQMMVLTGFKLGQELDVSSGDLSAEFLDLVLQMHPTGLGEGRNAADRYRIEGLPLVRGSRRLVSASDINVFIARDPSDPDVDPDC